MKRRLVIDCDPGADDAIALLLAFASPELEVLGVTTVAGNVPLALTSANALKVCALAGRDDVPVYAGCDRPLRRDLVTAAHVHGDTGLGRTALPPPDATLRDGHAADFLVAAVRGSGGGITLAPTGPLTNIAAALARAPDVGTTVREIVLMGGAVGPGNVTPAAEFNIHVDPDAAAAVFGCGASVTMVGLDVTHRALATGAHIAALDALGNAAGRFAAQLLRHYGRPDPARYGGPGVPLHDPCVIAYLLRPGLFAGRPARVSVETADGPELGRTRVGFLEDGGASANAVVMETIDAPGFFDLLIERLSRLP